MKKHKSQIKTSPVSGDPEVFVLPPDILEKLGIQLSQITDINGRNGENLVKVTKDDELDLPNSDAGSSILETASLMKKSVFLSPTFVSASTETPNELNVISNTAIDTEDTLFQDDNKSFKDNGIGRINNTNKIQSNIDNNTFFYNGPIQSEDLGKCEYIKEYNVDNNTSSSKPDTNTSPLHKKCSAGNRLDNLCLSDCSHRYLKITNNNLETIQEKQNPKHNKIKIISEKILNNSDITVIQNSVQRTSNSFLVPVNTIVTGKVPSMVEQDYAQKTIEREGILCTNKEVNMKIDVNNGQAINANDSLKSIDQDIVGDVNRIIFSDGDHFAINEVKTPTSAVTIYCIANHEEDITTNTIGIENDEEYVTTDIIPPYDSYEKSQEDIIDEKISNSNGYTDEAENASDIARMQLTIEMMNDSKKEIFSEAKNNIIKSKLCIQGVEKPGGSFKNKVLKTYQKSNIIKKIPSTAIFDSSDISYSKSPNNIDIEHDDVKMDVQEHTNIFCVCHDFGKLTNYDTDIVYEHIHFWNHSHNNGNLESLLSIYDDISPMREINTTDNLDAIDDEDVETTQNNICWLSFNYDECEESLTQVPQADITDDSTVVRRSPRKRKATATERVSEVSEPKSKKTIKCGACGLVLSQGQWNKHNESEHNSIAWKDGQTIDLESKRLLKKLELKLKQLKYLRCTFCKSEVKYSVKKYLAHIKLCIKRKVEKTSSKVDVKREPNGAETKGTRLGRRSSRFGINTTDSFLQNVETQRKSSVGSRSREIYNPIKSEDNVTPSNLKYKPTRVERDTQAKFRKCSQLATMNSNEIESPPKQTKNIKDLHIITKSTSAEDYPKIKRSSTDAPKIVTSESLGVGISTRSKRISLEDSTPLKNKKVSVGCGSLPKKPKTGGILSSENVESVPKLKECTDLSTNLASTSLIKSPQDDEISPKVDLEFVDSKDQEKTSKFLITPKPTEHEVHLKSIKKSQHVEVTKLVNEDITLKLARQCSDLYTKPATEHVEVLTNSKPFVIDQSPSKSSKKDKNRGATLKSPDAGLESTRISPRKSLGDSTEGMKNVFKVSPEIKGVIAGVEISSNAKKKSVSDKNLSKSLNTNTDEKVSSSLTSKSNEILTKSSSNVVAVSINLENVSIGSEITQKLGRCSGQSKLTENIIKAEDSCNTPKNRCTLKSIRKLKEDTEHPNKLNNTPVHSLKVIQSKDIIFKPIRQLTDIDIFAKTNKSMKFYSNPKKQTENTDITMSDASIQVNTPLLLENKAKDCSKSTQESSNNKINAQANFCNTPKKNTSNNQGKTLSTQFESSQKHVQDAVVANKNVSNAKKKSLGIKGTIPSSVVNKETPRSIKQNETNPEDEHVRVIAIKEEIFQCGVCKQEVEDSQWDTHVAKEHNYLAWRDGDPPLDLQDEEAVRSHLYAITKANGGLKCSKCGVVRKYVKTYMMHVRECDGVSTQVADVSSCSRNDSTADLDTTNEPDNAPLNTYSCSKKGRNNSSLENPTVVCGVCSLVLLESKWIEHIRLEHKYLAWKSDEHPLNLNDEAEVKSHLQNISKHHHGLKCSKCGTVRLYVKKFLDHESVCTGSKTESTLLEETLNASNESAKLIEIEILPENVKCGKCGEEVKGNDWMTHIEQKHNYLAWIEGNTPLDENNLEAVFAHLHRLVKKRGALLCVKCGLERKYPKAFLTHISACEITGFSREAYFVDVSEPLKTDEFECAVCHERGNRKDWKKHTMDKHYNIAWVAGETPINLKNPYAVEKYLKEYRRKHDLVCKVCGASRVSCYGFYAHILTCGKEESELEHLMNMCEICNNKYLCIYRNQHMAMHREQEYRKEQKQKCAKAKEEQEKEKLKVEPSGKRRAAEKAKIVMEQYKSNRTEDGSNVCTSCHIAFDNENQLKEHPCAEDDGDTDSDTSVKIEQDESDDDGDDDEDDDVDSNISNEEEEDNEKMKRQPEHISKLVLPFKVNDINYYLGKSYENFRDQHMTNERLFDCWRQRHCQILPQEDVEKYLPPLAESCKIRNDGDEWDTYERFKGRRRENGRNITLFTGASIRCMQWAPTCDDEKKQDHYLAIVCFRDADCPRYGSDELSQHPGLLQIWNIKRFSSDPKCEVGLAHDFGTIWAMDWCPSGARDMPESNEGETCRLGLLAVACSNGSAYILYVPRFLTESKNEPIIIKVEPVAELRFSMTPERSKHQATSLSWSPKKGHSVVMVGYSDGSTALYDLNTNSPFLKTTENGVAIYYPFEDTLAENSSITGVSLSASDSDHVVGGIASSSVTGATMSAWPTIGPVVRSHLAATSVIHTPHWPAALLCSDDVLTMKSTNEMEWWGGGRRMGGACAAGACIHCGRMCLTAPPFVRVLRAHPCYPELKKQIVATVKMIPLAQKRKLKLTNDDLGMIVEPLTYDEAIKKYGLEFKLVPKKNQKIASKLCDNAEQCPERFPLSDLPAASFCPSNDYHNRLAIASHAGFVFIICTS